MAYKLLIVDDNAEVRNLLRLTLSFDDYQIREATNGVDALAIIEEWRPHMAILDIMMPGEKDGLQVCYEVKHNADLKHTFIAMLTARGQTTDIKEGVNVGADTYLIKPFSPAVLRSVVTVCFDNLNKSA
ncbi:MAG: response regulator [Methylotenera sp.]|nr:response regulator [Methylotenera sp.]MDP1960377.1 response regulator [Methylotenera sp.]MDP3302850.1 response regulator [Methylotenera sp.]MDP3942338.1 response regulator [Methylotenera sp.]